PAKRKPGSRCHFSVPRPCEFGYSPPHGRAARPVRSHTFRRRSGPDAAQVRGGVRRGGGDRAGDRVGRGRREEPGDQGDHEGGGGDEGREEEGRPLLEVRDGRQGGELGRRPEVRQAAQGVRGGPAEQQVPQGREGVVGEVDQEVRRAGGGGGEGGRRQG